MCAEQFDSHMLILLKAACRLLKVAFLYSHGIISDLSICNAMWYGLSVGLSGIHIRVPGISTMIITTICLQLKALNQRMPRLLSSLSDFVVLV